MNIKKIVGPAFIIGVLILVTLLYFTHTFSDVARDELEAIRSEDTAYAYTLTSTAYQSHLSQEAFQTLINEHPILKDYIDVAFSDKKIMNGVAHLTGVVTGANGNKLTVEFELVKEGNDWKIQEMKFAK